MNRQTPSLLAYDDWRETRLIEALSKPPVQWEQEIGNTKPGARDQLAKDLLALSIAAARLSGYIEGRYPSGYESGHAAGVEVSNRRAVKTARVLGYSYPSEQEINF